MSVSVGEHIRSKRTILEQGHKELEGEKKKVSRSEENKELRTDPTVLGISRTHS